MIRFKNAARSALVAGMLLPAFAEAQGPKPAEPSTPARESVDVQEFRPSLSETSLILENVIGPEPAAQDRTIIEELKGPETVVVEGQAAPKGEEAHATTIRRVYDLTAPGNARQFATVTFTGNALESKFGLKLAPIDEALRTQLEIPKDEGVAVVEIKGGSLAEQAGLKAKDILLRLDDKPIANLGHAHAALLGLGKEAVQVKLIREGKPRQLSLVGPEHGFPPESSEFWIGVPVSPVDVLLRSHLGELPADAGLVANDVVKDSPADRAGVKKNDILISMGGKPLKSSDVLIAQVQASNGKPVPLVVLRSGKPTTLEVTPTKRAHPTVVTFKTASQPLQFQFFQPSTAIEVQKRIAGIPGQATSEFKIGTTFPRSPNIQLDMVTDRIRAIDADSNARLETQLKELNSKLDKLRESIEALKKPEGK